MRVQPIPSSDTESRIQRLEEVVDKHLGFGDVTSPGTATYNPSPLWEGAGPASTNGTVENVYGSWVKMLFTVRGGIHTAYHNLDLPTNDGLNVRWLIGRIIHNGNGVALPDGARSTICVLFRPGDTYTNNAVELRMYADLSRTINGAFNWVQVDMFFVPASASI